MKRIPTYLDRYPAKMVTTLADKIIDTYVDKGSSILDPFCGSGAILKAAQKKNCKLFGIDINPYAILLSRVKLNGFDVVKANKILEDILNNSQKHNKSLLTTYSNMGYWFTPQTLDKLYRIRFFLKKHKVNESREELAVLLSFALTIRLVSKADQRSPKPFISKISIEKRKGKHFDPYRVISKIFQKLSSLYGDKSFNNVVLKCENITTEENIEIDRESISHIITSPPYINAQDYFRNSKLELYFLEGILPFSAKEIEHSFIGTERGHLMIQNPIKLNRISKVVNDVAITNKRLSNVVSKYFSDMDAMFNNTSGLLKPNGKLILVCGDNIVAGRKLKTWELLNEMAETKGFKFVDSFKDKIMNRTLAPQRMGHKSLIKEEVVSVFKKKPLP